MLGRSGILYRPPARVVFDSGPELIDATGWGQTAGGTSFSGSTTSTVRKIVATNRRGWTFSELVAGGGCYRSIYYQFGASQIDLTRPYRVNWVFDLSNSVNAAGPVITFRWECPSTLTDVAGGRTIEISPQSLGSPYNIVTRLGALGGAMIAQSAQVSVTPGYGFEMNLDVLPSRLATASLWAPGFSAPLIVSGVAPAVVAADRIFGWSAQIQGTGTVPLLDGAAVYRMRIWQA